MHYELRGNHMKTLLSILLLLIPFQHVVAEEINNKDSEIILPISPKQKVYSRYQTDFSYHHDRGFYLRAALGPQWNHSVMSPNAKAIRFGGKFALGWYVADGIALFGSTWGNFLEEASLVAAGPGVALLFDGPNIGVDLSLGMGRVFNGFKGEQYVDFTETVMAANLSIVKYWWLSGKNSLGLSLNSGFYGLTLSQRSSGTFGWNIGLNIAYLLN